jgi:BolA protein
MNAGLSAKELEALLCAHFEPAQVAVEDESRQHAGHAHGGGGHFSVRIVSPRFAALSAVQRHRAVYAALGQHMGRGVHALRVQAYTPEEWSCRA